MVADDDVEQILRECEARRRDCLVADDMAGLAELLADDLVHVHTTGIVNDKQQLLAHAGGFLQFIDVRRESLLVRRIGPDAAVMTGPMTNIVRRRGHDEEVTVEAFVTQVWTRTDGAWRVASFHATRVAAPAA